MSHPPYFANAHVFSIKPDEVDIDAAGRIGLFYPAKAEALAELISVHGQNDPIKVVKRGNAAKTAWKLVAGLHRLEACRIAGVECFAIEVMGDADVLHSIQASENMDRRELAPLERAMFVNAVAEAARARVFTQHGVENDKALAAKAKANRVQFSDAEQADDDAVSAEANLASAYNWSFETAEACGLSKTDLKRSLRIYRCIITQNRDLIDAFKDHPVAQKASDLLEICALKDAGVRRKVIETLVGGPADLNSVLQMLGIKSPAAKPDNYSKFTGQIVTGWSRLATADKRRFIPEFVASIPAGMRKMLRDELEKIVP